MKFTMMTNRMTIAVAVGAGLTAGMLWAGEPEPIPQGEFSRLHSLIKPRAGESSWMEIDWHPGVWEARQKAAREGKPLFIWAGSGGAPAAGC